MARSDSGRCGSLLDGIAESSSVVADSGIARQDRNELRWFIEQLGGRQVYRIERPHRFHRKRPAHSGEDGAIDVDDEAPAFECPQPQNGGLFLGDGQPAGDTCPDDRSCGFRQRQGGGHAPAVGLERCQHDPVVFQ